MNSSKSYITYIKQLLFFAVLISGVILFVYKSSLARKQKSLTKVLLFVNSLIINDLSLRYVKFLVCQIREYSSPNNT